MSLFVVSLLVEVSLLLVHGRASAKKLSLVRDLQKLNLSVPAAVIEPL